MVGGSHTVGSMKPWLEERSASSFWARPTQGRAPRRSDWLRRSVFRRSQPARCCAARWIPGQCLGTRVRDVMAGGSLVGDDLMVELIVKDRLAQGDAAEGFLLDGYPRTVPQVRTLADDLAEARRRSRSRGTDRCAPKASSSRALSNEAAWTTARTLPASVKRSMSADTKPLVAIYEDEGLLRRVNGDQTEDEVARDVLKAVGYDARGTA